MDPMEMARSVCQPVENVVLETVSKSMTRLAEEDTQYLTSAVWGNDPDRQFDATQTEIFGKANIVVNETLNRLNLPGLDKAHEFTLNYMVRALMIAKLLHARDLYHLTAYNRGMENQ